MGMGENNKLSEIRAKIDSIDEQILKLVSERARLAQQVAQAKRAAGETGDFYRPEREAEVLRRVRDLNPGPLSAEPVQRLFRELMSACLALQQPLKVAYFGPEGTFTHAAAMKHFGHGAHMLPSSTIDLVFREVESGAANYGVVPVENSTEGVVSHTLDRFMASPLQIVGEVELPIIHNLASRAASFGDIRKVYSHQQALGQCRVWLEMHLPHAERIPVSSTAEAARLAAEDPATAAIASEAAAERYGVSILAAQIQDGSANTTRFLIIGRQSPPSTGEDKTSLVVSRTNQPGGLYKLLEPLARHGVNMSRIESRPSRQGMWEYVFFVDLLGHVQDLPVKQALEEMQAQASLLKILGSYPRAAR
jgi:chorismate mutase/prephenate dehydratase